MTTTSSSNSNPSCSSSPTTTSSCDKKDKDDDNIQQQEEDATTTTSLPDPSTMKISEIKKELKELGVSCNDCFDKESICQRLQEARSSSSTSTSSSSEKEVVDGGQCTPDEENKNDDEKEEEVIGESCCTNNTCTNNTQSTKNTTQSDFFRRTKEEESSKPTIDNSSNKNKNKNKFNESEVLDSLRSKRVRELRTMCAQSGGIRWATMIEKEELVQALLSYQKKVADFSPSGQLIPGKVSEITDVDLAQELSGGGGDGTVVTTPLLLDVYATWCGPCQMMAPLLEEASAELGDTVRVAKIDSDKYPACAARWKIGGFPTLIVFDGKTGKELERVEGALMKDDLVRLGRKHS